MDYFSLVKEALRLGQNIYLLLEVSIDNKSRLSIAKEALHDLKHNLDALGLKYTIQKFSSFNTGIS